MMTGAEGEKQPREWFFGSHRPYDTENVLLSAPTHTARCKVIAAIKRRVGRRYKTTNVLTGAPYLFRGRA